MGLIFGACSYLHAQAGPMKVEAQLLWGTDDAKSPNPKHKPIDPALRAKLKTLPLKWSNYFEENRVVLVVPQGGSKRTALSAHCDIELKNLDGTKVQVTHYGEGKKVATRTQELSKGELLVLGGNAPGATTWLVALRRAD